MMAGFKPVRATFARSRRPLVRLSWRLFTVGGPARPGPDGRPDRLQVGPPASAPMVRLENRADGSPSTCCRTRRFRRSRELARRAPTFAGVGQLWSGPADGDFGRAEAPRPLMSAPTASAAPYAGPPYQVSGTLVRAGARAELQRSRHRVVVRPDLPRQGFGLRRSVRRERDDGRSPDPADPVAGARHQPREWPHGYGAPERSRAVRGRPDHRPVEGRRRGARHAAKGTAKVRVEYVGPAPAEATAAPCPAL